MQQTWVKIQVCHLAAVCDGSGSRPVAQPQLCHPLHSIKWQAALFFGVSFGEVSIPVLYPLKKLDCLFIIEF